MSDVPDHWPNRAHSQRRKGPVHHWHFQEFGSGPGVLLLHGAGGSVHSVRDLAPLIGQEYSVIAPDLPGHGFTRLGAQRRSGLTEMSTDLWKLCDALDFTPGAIVGHSAGAAIALNMSRQRPVDAVIGINPALSKFDGLAGLLFPAMAKVMAMAPFLPKLFAGTASRPERILALIASTGSTLDQTGVALYRDLVSRQTHVSGTLDMMAQWDLTEILEALPHLETKVLFLTGSNDRTVRPSIAANAAERIPGAQHVDLGEFGHLVHEEAPDLVASAVLDFLKT